MDGLPDVGHPAFQTFANLALVGERSQFRREFVGHRQDALLHDHEDGGPALLHHRGLDQFALAGVELQAAQFRAEHHVGQRRLGIARGCLADHRSPLGQLVVKHGVGRRHVHQSVAYDEDAGLVQPVGVLGLLLRWRVYSAWFTRMGLSLIRSTHDAACLTKRKRIFAQAEMLYSERRR